MIHKSHGLSAPGVIFTPRHPRSSHTVTADRAQDHPSPIKIDDPGYFESLADQVPHELPRPQSESEAQLPRITSHDQPSACPTAPSVDPTRTLSTTLRNHPRDICASTPRQLTLRHSRVWPRHLDAYQIPPTEPHGFALRWSLDAPSSPWHDYATTGG